MMVSVKRRKPLAAVLSSVCAVALVASMGLLGGQALAGDEPAAGVDQTSLEPGVEDAAPSDPALDSAAGDGDESEGAADAEADAPEGDLATEEGGQRQDVSDADAQPEEDAADTGAQPSAGGSAPAVEQPVADATPEDRAATVTVTFGTDTRTVVAGASVTMPSHANSTYTLFRPASAGAGTVPATFKGWYGVTEAPTTRGVSGSGPDALEPLNRNDDTHELYLTQDRFDAISKEYSIYPAGATEAIDQNTTFYAVYAVPVCTGWTAYRFQWANGDVTYHSAVRFDIVAGDMISQQFIDAIAKEAQVDFLDTPFTLSSVTPTNATSTPFTRDRQFELVFLYVEDSMNPAPYQPGQYAVTGNAGVTAQGALAGPNIPDGAIIVVEANTLASGADYDALVRALSSGAPDGVFEVALLVNGKPVHDGFGELSLSFPVANAEGRWVTVYHRHQDGSITSQRVVAENGFATVAVTDLSAFALEIGERASAAPEAGGDAGADGAASDPGGAGESSDAPSGNGSESGLAQTGDTAIGYAWAAVALCACAIVALCAALRAPRGKHIR